MFFLNKEKSLNYIIFTHSALVFFLSDSSGFFSPSLRTDRPKLPKKRRELRRHLVPKRLWSSRTKN